MNFNELIGRGMVRKASRDENLARSLVKQAENDLSFFNSLEINELSSRKLVSNYYDILRAILEAMSALDGYKIYGHEAFSYYLKEKGEEVIAEKFDRFREIRNKINYYGRKVSVEQAKENIDDMKQIIKILKDRYLGGLT